VTAPKAQRAHRGTPREKVRVLQRTLYRAAKANPRRRFGVLYDKVCRRDVLEEATRRVLANRGAGGVDGQTVEQLRDYGVGRFVDELRKDLEAGRYRPSPVRRVFIPKPDGRQRPLGIPTVRDRVAQMAVKLVIEPLFEADFSDCSWGFRPRRGAKGAHEVIRRAIVNGARFVILTRTEEAARRYFAWLEKLFDRMALQINREKTRIAPVSDGFDFLGLTFKEGRGRGTGRRFALTYPRRKAMQAIRQKVKETVRRHLLSVPVRQVVNDLNPVLRGWGTYFRDSNASRHFRLIDRQAAEQVRLLLRRKHRRMDRRGYRDWPDQFLCRELGLYRLSGRLATRRSVECRTG
jgi:hypothetical protein